MTLGTMIALAALGIVLLWILRWALRVAVGAPPPPRHRRRHGRMPAWSVVGQGHPGSHRRPTLGDLGDVADAGELVHTAASLFDRRESSGTESAGGCTSSDIGSSDVSSADCGGSTDTS